ncbi:TPA: hypothetical protein I8P56_004862 [Salmonella enterica subsp. enterica serovar Napoli]|nr:hypothetical protein [Salmonella enterica subsp. enterica serovar Napoli]
MIFTESQTLIGARSTGGAGSAPPTKPPFITPDMQRSVWTRAYEGSNTATPWVFAKGNRTITANDIYFSGDTPWEIRCPVARPADLLRLGCKTRFSFSVDDISDAALEGKDLLEVRLVITDDSVPPAVRVPPATPDKPYLVLGWVARCVAGQLSIRRLDGAEPAQITGLGALRRYSQWSLGLSVDDGTLFHSMLYNSANNGSALTLMRTGINTPANTLCIRSGATPAKSTHFFYLDMVAPHEVITHRLTPEDDGATFYCPWGAGENPSLVLPDSPLPAGFSVNMVTERYTHSRYRTENAHVSVVSTGTQPPSTATLSGKSQLIQVGPNGKTWCIM